MNEDALTYQYTSLHIVTQSQAEAKTKKTASARKDPVGAEIKKMEQELLLYINEGYKESLRLTCWDYGGQAEFLKSSIYIYIHTYIHIYIHIYNICIYSVYLVIYVTYFCYIYTLV